MAKTATATAEATPASPESNDGPLLDTLNAAIKKMIAAGKERGYVTYDELNAALPPEQVTCASATFGEDGVDVAPQPEAGRLSTVASASVVVVEISWFRPAAEPFFD